MLKIEKSPTGKSIIIYPDYAAYDSLEVCSHQIKALYINIDRAKELLEALKEYFAKEAGY